MGREEFARQAARGGGDFTFLRGDCIMGIAMLMHRTFIHFLPPILQMKRMIAFCLLAAVAVALTGCGSMRTPESGKNAGKTYYCTFFGISLESAVYGDGLIVNAK